MPHISACIGSIELALASIATTPLSRARAIQALSSANVRTVWYLLRSTGVLRAASARAAASEIGVPLRLAGLFSLSPPVLLGSPLPVAGATGASCSAKRSPPAARRGGGEEPADLPLDPLLFLSSASTSAGS